MQFCIGWTTCEGLCSCTNSLQMQQNMYKQLQADTLTVHKRIMQIASSLLFDIISLRGLFSYARATWEKMIKFHMMFIEINLPFSLIFRKSSKFSCHWKDSVNLIIYFILFFWLINHFDNKINHKFGYEGKIIKDKKKIEI